MHYLQVTMQNKGKKRERKRKREVSTQYDRNW